MKALSISIILLTLLLTGCGDKSKESKNVSNKNNTEQTSKQKMDSPIILTDVNGEKIEVTKTKNGLKFAGYENKIVILDFFATWCPPCKAEMPHLVNLQEKYKNDVQIIGILLEEHKTNDQVIQFMNKFNINFKIVNSNENFRLAQKVGGVDTIPFTMIFDKNSTYFQHYTGAVPEEMIDIDIQKAL
jgi:thiol-disulfide isomerase/thioredoxin